jgi:hypothetical protein
MSDAGRRYRFPPLERRGLILGFGGPQLAALGSAALVAVMVIRALPNMTGLLLAAVIVAAAGAAGCWTISGRPPSSWLPVVVRWAWRRAVWDRRSDAPLQGFVTTPLTHRLRPAVKPPPALAGIQLVEAPDGPGLEPLGVVVDARTRTYAAAVVARGRSFSLLDPSDKERRLAAWAAVLSGLCREGGPIHRVQWIERRGPGDRHALRRHVDASGALSAGTCRQSYDELVSGAGPVGQHHQVLIVVAIRPRRAGGIWPGQPATAPYPLLRRELRLLHGQLDAADVAVEGVLTAPDLAAVIQGALDPSRASAPAGSAPWPLAADEGWSAYRTDGAWHATYWIAEWPRVEVGPDFLSPLLLGGVGHRTVSVVMAPVAPGEAARQVEAARTADVADEQLRRRAGFLATARHRRQAEGVVQREAELAEGHGEFRFSGYVTVTVVEQADLNDACAEVEQCARQANLELRRLYGQQEAAFCWTLPLARGLS